MNEGYMVPGRSLFFKGFLSSLLARLKKWRYGGPCVCVYVLCVCYAMFMCATVLGRARGVGCSGGDATIACVGWW